MQMQGKVFDGQYLTRPFIQAVNEPITEWLKDAKKKDCNEDPASDYWWPTQWDSGHWLDLVFEKFKSEEFISRLLSRTNLVHRQFGHGKLHSVSKATAGDLNLPFQVTVSFAAQRFMSSSYLQFLKLQRSLEVYFETFRDHDNSEINEYKIAGSDFVYDLLGTIDLLWPLALLMTRGQLEWCPAWKLPGWVPLVDKQLRLFSAEMKKDARHVPANAVSPRLNEHGKSIQRMKYGSVDHFEGWLIVQEIDKDDLVDDGEVEKESEDERSPPKPVKWKLREIKDCKADLADLAESLRKELQRRYKECLPQLMLLLHKCLDFGVLFDNICGNKTLNQSPIDTATYIKVGQAEFLRCVNFVAQLPHMIPQIVNGSLNIAPEFADIIFWQLKNTLINVVWGDFFPNFFVEMFMELPPLRPDDAKSKSNKEAKPQRLKLQENASVTAFKRIDDDYFDLGEKYVLKLDDGSLYQVVFHEENLIRLLYTDQTFYSAVGREFALVFHIFYAKTGTEAVAESFYRVMNMQEQDGGQKLETLANRSRVDWCLPSVLQCERPIQEMAKLYIEGDTERGPKKAPNPNLSESTNNAICNRHVKSTLPDC